MALFRKLMNASDEQQSALAGDLNAQIARAQEERQALEALVASAQAHLAQLPQVNASLEETERRATGIGQQIENLVARVEDLENIQRQTKAAEARILALEGMAQTAEARFQQALARETQIEEHRSAIDQLVSLGRSTASQLDGLKQESVALRQLEERLPRLRKEFQPLLDQQSALKNDIDVLRCGNRGACTGCRDRT